MRHDIHRRRPQAGLTRRELIVTALATGFALAVQPVSAAARRTASDGLTSGAVTLPTPDGALPAYRAASASGGPFPVVLVVQQIFGVHEYI